MKKALIISMISLVLILPTLHAQDCDGQRYLEPIFGDVEVEYGISYGEAPQPNFLNPNATQELTLDFYEPEGDTLSARPLIIWAFGGSFVFGSSLSPDLVDLSTRFSELGYVNASINYRLSTDLIWDNETLNAYSAVKKAMQDMKASVRFFYKDAQGDNEFRVDTTRIYVGGVSAGAIAAVHLAYLDDLSEVPDIILDDILNEGGLEGQSGNPGYSSDVQAVINLSGGILDTAWIQPFDEPIVSLHGNEDGTVPYGDEMITTLGVNLPFNGSATIAERMDELQINHSFYTFWGEGHTPFVFDGDYMDTTFWQVRDFLYDVNCTASSYAGTLENGLSGKLFPNPSLGLSEIQYPITLPNDVLLLGYDISGREVSIDYEIMGSSIILDGNGLAQGVYFLELRNEQGIRYWQGKWMLR